MKAVCAALLTCLAALTSPVAAQQQEKAPCPAVKVTGPTDYEIFTKNVGSGPMTFTAEVNGRQPDETVTIKWLVSGGEISNGQGTPTITVDAGRSLPVQCVTVVAEFDGLGAECPRKATWASLVEIGIVEKLPRLFDDYGDIPLKQEKKHLDNVALAMRDYSGSRLYIVGYEGPNRRNEKAARRAERARDYLIKKHGIEAGRIALGPKNSLFERPHSEFALEFWLDWELEIPPCKEEPQ